MEWLKAILEKAEIKDGKLDVEALMSTINVEAPKNVMPKAEYNNISKQLKEANNTIKDLKKDNSKRPERQNIPEKSKGRPAAETERIIQSCFPEESPSAGKSLRTEKRMQCFAASETA